MIPVARPVIGEKEKGYVLQALESGWVSSSGEFIVDFEKALQSYVGSEYACTTSNGTAALHLALIACGIGPGDEVIVPSVSFVATVNAVLYVGATPIFVDIEQSTWGMDPELVSRAITNKTKAILCVHLYGYPCDVMSLRRIADERGVVLIEDAAESFGATVGGKQTGTIGDIGVYSFFGNKNITTGEGGAVVTNNPQFAESVSLYKNHGRKHAGEYLHEVVGYNYRMTNLQAAIGLAQLEQVDMFLQKRIQIESVYDSILKNIVRRQSDVFSSQHVNWLYACLLPDTVDPAHVIDGLKQSGIDTRRLFYPMNQMPYFSLDVRSIEFPVGSSLFKHGINLPTFVGLSDDEVEMIAKTVVSFC